MSTNPMGPDTAVEVANRLGARWSDTFDAYASGRAAVSQIRCVLCQTAPCSCTTCPQHTISGCTVCRA